jgi:hypothetical protein
MVDLPIWSASAAGRAASPVQPASLRSAGHGSWRASFGVSLDAAAALLARLSTGLAACAAWAASAALAIGAAGADAVFLEAAAAAALAPGASVTPASRQAQDAIVERLFMMDPV